VWRRQSGTGHQAARCAAALAHSDFLVDDILPALSDLDPQSPVSLQLERAVSHDQARSRAYRWGEEGPAGLCDEKQRLCFALALWNERDPILKERRLFGLTNSEGNHGEDVKEYYF
jgi:hypothetical protein